MYTQGLDASELFRPTGRYDGMRHYAHTKRAQVVLAAQLHERLTVMGIGVHSMHPGWVDTPAIRRAMPKFTFLQKAFYAHPSKGPTRSPGLQDTMTHLSILNLDFGLTARAQRSLCRRKCPCQPKKCRP